MTKRPVVGALGVFLGEIAFLSSCVLSSLNKSASGKKARNFISEGQSKKICLTWGDIVK